METLDIPDADRERIETLRAELADQHAGPYAAVGSEHVLAYLLDLAEAVDDPAREADPERVGSPDRIEDGPSAPEPSFDRETVREQLGERNRKHSDPDESDRMDLYTIAAEFDVAGRSGMTKDELIAAILDRAAELAADPFSAVDVELDGVGDADADRETGGADGSEETAGGEDGDSTDDDATSGSDDDATSGSDDDEGGSTQLDAMMSLLDTHDDKWREADGDVRYEVDLPDGSVETARTKDDVRALLFRNY